LRVGLSAVDAALFAAADGELARVFLRIDDEMLVIVAAPGL
jgi:hypothetical protein